MQIEIQIVDTHESLKTRIDSGFTACAAQFNRTLLAKDLNAELRLVHVVDVININLGADFPYPPGISKAIAKTGQEILNKAGTVARYDEVPVETQLIEMDSLGQRIPEVIAADAEAWPADLIVIGTHGRRGLSHLFLGSVAEGVVRTATKPVLLIRGK